MLPSALRYAPYRFYLAGNFFGLTGAWILRISLGWLAWEVTGSAAFTGMVAFLNFAPVVISGPFFGVLADHIDPRRGMMASQAMQATLAAILMALALHDALTPTALMIGALCIGLAASAYHPFRMALAPRLVPPEVLSQALAMGAMNFNITRMLGPALGGWLIHDHGAAAAVALAGLMFLPQIGAFLFIDARPAERDESAPASRGGVLGVFDQIGDGARHAFADPLIREAVLMNALIAVAMRGALELLPVAADGLFNQGAGGFGALTAMAGAGAVVSAIWMAWGQVSAEAMRMRARVCSGLALLLTAMLGLVESWPLALATVAGLGFLGTVVGVSNQTIAQSRTPDSRRGRVMSLWFLMAIGGASLGSVGIGALADVIGLRMALIATAFGCAVLAPALAWRLREPGVHVRPPNLTPPNLTPRSKPSGKSACGAGAGAGGCGAASGGKAGCARVTPPESGRDPARR